MRVSVVRAEALGDHPAHRNATMTIPHYVNEDKSDIWAIKRDGRPGQESPDLL